MKKKSTNIGTTRVEQSPGKSASKAKDEEKKERIKQRM